MLENLEKLVDFTDNLPKEQWFWENYTSKCGTLHCMAGNLPLCFPDDFKYAINGTPVPALSTGDFSIIGMCPFLGITSAEFIDLKRFQACPHVEFLNFLGCNPDHLLAQDQIMQCFEKGTLVHLA